MRHLTALLLALLTASAGCGLFGHKRATEPPGVQRRASSSIGPEVVFLDAAVVECPPRDRYLDADLWDSSDEQGVDLELKPLLEANGLRVGQFGLLPDRLQSLLASPRSCPAPRRYRNEPDKPTPLQVGPVRATCSFELPHGDGKPKTLTLEQARCEFDVLPILEDDNRIRLRVTPRVRHGQPHREMRPVRDPDGQLRWSIESAEPTEELTDLRFELSVGSGEYVAIGTRYDREGTWGRACFVSKEEKVQRLLVVRATRVPGGDETASASAPLALQATRTARGSSR